MDRNMKTKTQKTGFLIAALMITGFCSCERLDNDPNKHIADRNPEYIELQEFVEILTLLPIGPRQLSEVHDAVCSSSENGYDEEYLMSNMFCSPGSGVGDKDVKSGNSYEAPMRNLITDAVMDLSDRSSRTRSEHSDLNVLQTLDRIGPDAFLDALERSDIQIYWPFSEGWDGNQIEIVAGIPLMRPGGNVCAGIKFNLHVSSPFVHLAISCCSLFSFLLPYLRRLFLCMTNRRIVAPLLLS